MAIKIKTLVTMVLMLCFFGCTPAFAQLSPFPLSNGVTEQCIALAKVPGGVYTESDWATEKKFCQIDFNSFNVALCPKVHSTSPATYIYDITELGVLPAEAEARCHHTMKHGTWLGAYKQSMNQGNTSATHSMSSLLYYHLSRFFETNVMVPVAVYRSMDKDAHFQRVSSKAKGLGAMIRAAWDWMRMSELSPRAYNERQHLFTSDMKQIYGVLISPIGTRSGSYFYGTRESGWRNQYKDLKVAPPFVALSAALPLADAIGAGVQSIQLSSMLRAETGNAPSSVQMVVWMQDLLEMAVLDFILSQQDRIGNVDYIWAWAYLEDGKVHYQNLTGPEAYLTRVDMAKIDLSVPYDLIGKKAHLVQRTILGDNDAGGLVGYANFTKSFQVLEDIRHMNPRIYLQLQRLAKDIEKNGELKSYLKDNFVLGKADYTSLLKNIRLAASILRSSCKQGLLRFDLDLPSYISNNGQVQTAPVNCEL